jgi:hypothetical protein
VAGLLGQEFTQNFAVLPAQGTRGEILLACSGVHYVMSQVVTKDFSVTATITSTTDNAARTVTGVYGPQDTARKQHYLQELRQCKPATAARRILMVDFNLIHRAYDKEQSASQSTPSFELQSSAGGIGNQRTVAAWPTVHVVKRHGHPDTLQDRSCIHLQGVGAG